jgi:hypothetical protein
LRSLFSAPTPVDLNDVPRNGLKTSTEGEEEKEQLQTSSTFGLHSSRMMKKRSNLLMIGAETATFAFRVLDLVAVRSVG